MDYYRQYSNRGMHRNVSPFSIETGEWELLVNWDITKIGALTKRGGYSQILNAPDASEVLNIIPFQVGTTRRLIMINAAGKLYSADPVADSTWGAAILTGLSTSARWGWTMLHDDAGTPYMILGNGLVVYKTTDGVNFSTVSGAPLGKFWASLYERVYAAGVPADKDVLHWCSIGDLTDWSAVSPSDSSSLNVDKFAGGNIQGIRASNDRIVIYKDELIKRWDEEYLKTVMASDGLNAPYSLAEIDGMVFSLDRNAVRLYDGNVPLELMSKNEDVIFGLDFGATNSQRMCGEVFKKKYFLSVGTITLEDGSTISNGWIVYDYNKNMFWLYSLADQATAMTRFVNTNGAQKLYFGDTAGKVYEMFASGADQDNLVDIEARAEGHIIYPAGPEIFIDPREITVAAKFGKQMAAMFRDDYTDNVFTLGSCDAGVTKNITDALGNNVLGVQVKLAHATKGTPTFYGFSIGYETEGTKSLVS